MRVKVFIISMFILVPIAIKAQYRGYLGRPNAFSISLTELLLNSVNLEYKYSFSKDYFLWGMVSPYTIDEKIYETGSGSSIFSFATRDYNVLGKANGSGFDWGIGIGQSNTGLEVPLGFYYSFVYVRHGNEYTETAERELVFLDAESGEVLSERQEAQLDYTTKGNSYRIYFGKNIPLNTRFTLDYRFEVGASFYYITCDQSRHMGEEYVPLDIHPTANFANMPTVYDEHFSKTDIIIEAKYDYLTLYTGFNLRIEFHL